MDYAKICYNCMQEKEVVGKYCPYCGFRNEDYECPDNILPPLTPLHGRYVLGRYLGAGGFGITYVALDTNLQIVVAIKEMFLRNISIRHEYPTISAKQKNKAVYEENRRRFMDEAKILAHFSDNNRAGIVGVKDSFEENNTVYIVMEYLKGVTLRQKAGSDPLTFEEMCQLMDPIFGALTSIHQGGMVHLDISPDNIMIMEDGSAKLLDFGGAKIIGDTEDSGQYTFKRGYSPMEQRNWSGRNRVGVWTDIYSLAATMYYCLSGVKPPDAANRMTGVELQPLSSMGVVIPKNAERAILRAMEMEPERRYQSVKDFLKDMMEPDRPAWMIGALIAEVVIAIIALAVIGFALWRNHSVGTGARSPEYCQEQVVELPEEIAEEAESGLRL